MSRGLGFGDLVNEERTLRLPPKKAAQPASTPRETLPKDALAREGAQLGFVSREPAAETQSKAAKAKSTEQTADGRASRPTGRRKTPQAKLLVAGRKDVLDRFQQMCWERDLAYWAGLELLLDRYETETPPSS